MKTTCTATNAADAAKTSDLFTSDINVRVDAKTNVNNAINPILRPWLVAKYRAIIGMTVRSAARTVAIPSPIDMISSSDMYRMNMLWPKKSILEGNSFGLIYFSNIAAMKVSHEIRKFKRSDNLPLVAESLTSIL